MEDNGNKSMEPSKELYEKLIREVYDYKREEREMALDRYRRADEAMDSAESFILMGKNAIDFLKQAASSSDGIEKLAKEIKSIVYKEDSSSNVEVNFNDVTKRSIIDAMKEEEEKEKMSKNIPDEDLTDKDE